MPWGHRATELVSGGGILSCWMPCAVGRYAGTQWSATCGDRAREHSWAQLTVMTWSWNRAEVTVLDE